MELNGAQQKSTLYFNRVDKVFVHYCSALLARCEQIAAYLQTKRVSTIKLAKNELVSRVPAWCKQLLRTCSTRRQEGGNSDEEGLRTGWAT
jgi:hypothetical protein